jgi:hypothetical protein
MNAQQLESLMDIGAFFLRDEHFAAHAVSGRIWLHVLICEGNHVQFQQLNSTTLQTT